MSVESFFYYLTKKYKDYNNLIIYRTGDVQQLKRLKKYAVVVQFNEQTIKCKKAYFNYTKDIIDRIDADEYIEIVHRDPEAEKWTLHPKITRWIGVSQLVCDHFKKVYGKDCELIYNPIILEKPKKPLLLITASRLTPEKGKENIVKLADMFDRARIPYLWLIFTNDTNAINNPNIVYMSPKLDITNYIAKADFLVQLSKDEAFCYSVVESLCVGTPVIVTDCPVFKEIGVKDGVNGYICDFGLTNVDVEKIYNTELKFTYTAPKDTWGEELVKSPIKIKRETNELNTVQALENFTYTRFGELKNMMRFDAHNNKIDTIYTGDIFDCDDEIMNFLLNNGEGNKLHRNLVRVLVYKDE